MANLKNAGWGAYVSQASNTRTITGQLTRVSKQIGKIPKVQNGMLDLLNGLNLSVSNISDRFSPPVIDRISPSAMVVIHSLNLARTALYDARDANADSTNTQLSKHRHSKNYKHVIDQLQAASPELFDDFKKQFLDIPQDTEFESERLARMAQLMEFERKIAKTLLA
jgi:hypothetical protein